MDTILAIETSTHQGSIARFEEGRPAEFIQFTSGRSHNSVLFAPLEQALKGGPPDLIVVGTGPGSYSGIRVGIAAGLGLSLAYGIPLIGLPSLLALGETYALERYALAGDARRGSWWFAEVIGGELAAGPVVDDASASAARTAQWPGQLFTLDTASPPFCQARPAQPRADVLACRAGVLTESTVARLAAQETEPLYLRAPFITVSRKSPGLPRLGHGAPDLAPPRASEVENQ